MRTDILPFSPPLIGEGEIAEVVDTLRSDWITTGPKVKQFELEFARDRGTGSPGCELLYGSPARCPQDASDGAGDVVITTPMTFCSGVHVIEQVGACPVLVPPRKAPGGSPPGLLTFPGKVLNISVGAGVGIALILDETILAPPTTSPSAL